MLNDNATLKYIDGVATHWYWDSSMTKEIHKLAKTDKKDTFLLASESCKLQQKSYFYSVNAIPLYVDFFLHD